MSISEDREKNIAKNHEKHAAKVAQAHLLKKRGYSNVAIANKMGTSESSIRSLLQGDA